MTAKQYWLGIANPQKKDIYFLSIYLLKLDSTSAEGL